MGPQVQGSRRHCAEIAEAVAAGAMIGTHSFTRGYPVLHFALQDHRDRHDLGYA